MLDLKAIFEPDESSTISAAESCPAAEDRKAVDMPTRVEAVVSERSNDWPAALADFVLLLAPDDLPVEPFELNPWTTVVDRGEFLRWLQADIRRGHTGPRARLGSLQTDLRQLRERLRDLPQNALAPIKTPCESSK